MRLFQWYGAQVISRVDKNVQDAIKKSIFWIQRDAKIACPVITGRLKSSISSNWSGSGLGRAPIEAPVPESKPDDGVGEPKEERGVFIGVTGTNVEYGEGVEMGGSRKVPQGYLRPAFDKHKDFRKYIRKI